MFGKPEDVEGECNSHLYIGDDYGDNHSTMRCRLPKGHEGPHREEFRRDGGQVVVTWEKDEREAAEKERRYFDELREIELGSDSGRYHVDWWGQCRSCAHWGGNRESMEDGTCANKESDLCGRTTTTDGECQKWSSFDPEIASKVKDLETRYFGKDGWR